MGLEYLGHGTSYRNLASHYMCSQDTVGRAVNAFVDSVNSANIGRVVFPPINPQACIDANAEVCGFPQVLGCIDGSHFLLKTAPRVNPMAFYNRKKTYSLNVLAIAEADLNISFVFTNFGGRSNDGYILKSSPLWVDNGAHFDKENGLPAGGCILADSGFGLRHNILTPYSTAEVDGDITKRLYNLRHAQTRNCVEKSFGVCKSRWRLAYYGMRMEPVRAAAFVTAMISLHNKVNYQ